jgi:cell division protein FtsI (penicillin-binding protein 3)
MGGTVAAPVFKAVAERLVELEPSLLITNGNEKTKPHIEQVLAAKNKESGTMSYLNKSETTPTQNSKPIKIQNKKIMPNVINYNLRDAMNILNQVGVKYKVIGNGKVISQSIEPGFRLQPNSVCSITCEEKKVTGIKLN